MQASQNFTLSKKHDFCVLTMHLQGGVNHLNHQFLDGFEEMILKAKTQSSFKALVIKSSYDHFCVGADLKIFDELQDDAQINHLLHRLHQVMRNLEKSSFPVVSLINGNALGGGYELALATHLRIAITDPSKDDARIGLPEVLLGLIPGAGGTQRLSRLIGLQPALELISQGKTLTPSKALKSKLIDEIVSQEEEAWVKIDHWIQHQQGFTQPWDQKYFSYPGIQPQTIEARQLFMATAGLLMQKTSGSAKHLNILIQCMQESAHLHIDEALKVESRAFREVLSLKNANAMIRSLYWHKKSLEKLSHWDPLISQLPADHLGMDCEIKKVGILGAGMMGASLAFVCARADYLVVIRDIKEEVLSQASQHIQKLYDEQKIPTDIKHKQIAKCQFTTDLNLLSDCDLVIEAVFEDLSLKHQVIKETEAILMPHAIFASNTSALPIDDLNQVSIRPGHFIGLHFFSPVEKMPLLEIIIGQKTEQKTLYKCLIFGKSIKKTPVVVRDGYGFFTTRVFASYLLEAATLVAQGYCPEMIEWVAKEAGMAMPPLKIFDEVSLKLGLHAIQMRSSYGHEMDFGAGCALIQKMIDHQRFGKINKAGFYDYLQKPSVIAPILQDFIAPEYQSNAQIHKNLHLKSTQEINALKTYLKNRLFLIQAIEASRALEEGVLLNQQDGDVASVLGIGFAPQSGGIFEWMKHQGQDWLITQSRLLEQQEGKRFTPPKIWENHGFF